MSDTEKCPHGYPLVWRCHCNDCEWEEDLNEAIRERDEARSVARRYHLDAEPEYPALHESMASEFPWIRGGPIYWFPGEQG